MKLRCYLSLTVLCLRAVGTFLTGAAKSKLPRTQNLLFVSAYLLAVLVFSNTAFAQFTATGSMSTARLFYTATLLPNGKVLVAGGFGNTGYPLSSAELYDPATGAFTATGSMTITRGNHTATLLPTGKVLVAGGQSGSTDTELSTAELYDPATGTFTATGGMTIAHNTHTATLLGNGKVLIAGGSLGPFCQSPISNAELYDPATGTFTPTGSLISARFQAAATLLSSGKVLVTGGGRASCGGAEASAELYDPVTGTFAATGSMNSGRFSFTLTLLGNGKVLAAGGSTGPSVTSSADLYDPAGGTFTATASMSTPRVSHTATLLANGQALVAGGATPVPQAVSSAELYDPASGAFSATGSMTAARTGHTATRLNNGQVLIAGGYNNAGVVLASAELYKQVVDTTPPIVSNVAVSPNPVAVSTDSTLTATVDDSTTGGSNIASAYYSIDGGAPSQMLLTPSSAITTQASANLAPFPQSNVYNVCVHGTDSASNTSADACIPLPVYDPTGGFVTGGGQVASPVGADLLNTLAAGQATFGFVSKYLPGMNVPSGNLEFQFKEGNLDFKSTSMDWLVVTGEPRAKFHGTGTVNGANVCNFEVDAWAGSFTGNVDAFGLKITACANGGDRYSLSATALTKGSIIIHQ